MSNSESIVECLDTVDTGKVQTDVTTYKPPTLPLKVAVIVSGNGSNLQVLIDAMQHESLPIEIVGVISNVQDAYAITRAKQANLATAVFSHITSGENTGKRMGIKTFERNASHQLNQWQPDLIVLAGFMRVLSAEFISSTPAPMINLHPSLLPKYKGLNTHDRVLESDDRFHGCSIHMVTAELDAGQVLTQGLLAVDKNETADLLQSRVQKLEHQILPWTVLLIAQGVLNTTCLANPLKELYSNSSLPSLPYKLWLD